MKQYSLKEAAEVLGLRPDSLRKQANRQSLRAYKIGRDWVVDDDELRRYQKENKRVR